MRLRLGLGDYFGEAKGSTGTLTGSNSSPASNSFTSNPSIN